MMQEEMALTDDFRSAHWRKADVAADRDFRVAIVGSGMSGIAAAYRLEHKPSLTSRHIKGKAIDMDVSGIVGKTMKDKDGNEVEIASVQALYDVGAGYGTFCEEVSRLGFDRVIALEPEPHLAQTCRDKGLEVIEAPVEQAQHHGEQDQPKEEGHGREL